MLVRQQIRPIRTTLINLYDNRRKEIVEERGVISQNEQGSSRK